MNLKQNRGFGLADAIIAVAILMIFTGLIITISYNIYKQSNFIKRNEQATNYIVEIFEYAQGLVYEDVTLKNIKDYINDKYDNVEATDGPYSSESEKLAAYTIFININETYQGYVKELDITVMYKLTQKNKTVNMKTLISK